MLNRSLSLQHVVIIIALAGPIPKEANEIYTVVIYNICIRNIYTVVKITYKNRAYSWGNDLDLKKLKLVAHRSRIGKFLSCHQDRRSQQGVVV